MCPVLVLKRVKQSTQVLVLEVLMLDLTQVLSTSSERRINGTYGEKKNNTYTLEVVPITCTEVLGLSPAVIFKDKRVYCAVSQEKRKKGWDIRVTV